jgi:hypothetical protein
MVAYFAKSLVKADSIFTLNANYCITSLPYWVDLRTSGQKYFVIFYREVLIAEA